MPSTLTIIQPKGSLDATNSDVLRAEITRKIATNDLQSEQRILINCQDITFMDSSGLSALVMALKQAKAARSQFALCALNEQAMLLFRVTGMNKVFDIFEDKTAYEQAAGISCHV